MHPLRNEWQRYLRSRLSLISSMRDGAQKKTHRDGHCEELDGSHVLIYRSALDRFEQGQQYAGGSGASGRAAPSADRS
jgi:hypothetical protein